MKTVTVITIPDTAVVIGYQHRSSQYVTRNFPVFSIPGTWYTYE